MKNINKPLEHNSNLNTENAKEKFFQSSRLNKKPIQIKNTREPLPKAKFIPFKNYKEDVESFVSYESFYDTNQFNNNLLDNNLKILLYKIKK